MSLHEVDRSIQDTELWMLLTQKAEAEMLPTEFVASVNEICARGLTLAKDIIRFFPTFTLHDNVHICNVCDWMYKLLGDHAEEITAVDAALLVMSAACHDLGMSVSEAQKAELIAAAKNCSAEWEIYFMNHSEEAAEFQCTGNISDQMLRNYVRLHHHERVRLQLPKGADWPKALAAKGISRDVFLRLCKSHGEPIEALPLMPADQRSKEYHLLPCALLLRLADILDFDGSRAPEVLYHHLGLDDPKGAEAAFSKMEWDKNCANPHFELVDGILLFTAECTSMQVEHQVRVYMNWLQKELDECSRALLGRVFYWDGFQPPYKVEVEIHPDGYKSGPFCLTMEQDRILELLAGKNLYSDPGVFVRELLQNAIDAVQTRASQDYSFQLEHGRIVIHTWMDNSGYSWFRIEDNGTGMDQDIILNHFLKVGSSYYNSDRFKRESRKHNTEDHYTPISRFGIGILSCFMNDPEHNKLQLSTKRFAQVGSPAPAAIRMNVDGLHGYYYLAEEGAQITESDLLPMSHPFGESDEENCYRGKAGTTICVRLNLYQLGNLRTLKELVDRYVQFPTIRVEYYGQEGQFVYPTQQELMEEVHSANPDGKNQPLKEHCYYISDEDFVKLKEEHPEIVWEADQKPGVILKYCPLDWMAPGNQVSGMAVFAEALKPKCHISWPWSEEKPAAKFSLSYDNSLQRAKLVIKSDFPDEIVQTIPNLERFIVNDGLMINSLLKYPEYQEDPEWRSFFSKKYGVKLEEIPRLYRDIEKKKKELMQEEEKLKAYKRARTSFTLYFSYTELSADYPRLSALPDYFQKSGTASVDSQTIVAFNGVLADQSQFLGRSDTLIGIILLLQQNFRPEVNLARNTINELSLEAMAALSILQRKLGFSYARGCRPEAFQANHFLLKSEEEIQALLEKQTALKDELRLGGYPLQEVKKLLQTEKILPLPNSQKNSLYDILCLAAAKQLGTVCQRFDSSRGFNYNPFMDFERVIELINDLPVDPDLKLWNTLNDNTTASFPVALFFAPEGEDKPLAMISYTCINLYNREHSFSKWLISQQRKLIERVPSIYNTLLEVMVITTEKKEICEKLNDGLKRLQRIPGNPYEVTNSLFLETSDFI